MCSKGLRPFFHTIYCFGNRVSKFKGDSSMSSTFMIRDACDLPKAVESLLGRQRGFSCSY